MAADLDDDMMELRIIVDTLNKAPFNMQLTLVAMHNKSPQELLQVVNDVFTHLNPKMKKDLRDEAQEIWGQRMIEFCLGALGYKVPNHDVAAFATGFLEGNHEIVYPVMSWVLNQRDVLAKRAYLARFLTPLQIPEEMFADNNIVSLLQEYKEHQDKFKEVHQEVDAIRDGALNPVELQNEIEQLAQEREQLTSKLGKLKDKVKMGNEQARFEEIRQATHLLRKEQEQESQILQSLMDEKQKLKRSEQLLQQARDSLRQLEESNIARQNPQKLISKLRESVKKLKDTCNNKMPEELHKREKVLHDLEDVMSADPLSEQQVQALTYETNELQGAVEQLTQKRDNLLATADGQVGFFRDRVTAMEKKRDKLEEQLEELEEDKKEAENDLRQLDSDLKALNVGGGTHPKSDKEMAIYVKELSKKTEVYKQKKEILQHVRNEVEILANTEKVLRSRDDNISEFNEAQAKEKGVAGYQQTQEAMENLAASKQQIDTNKGQTLDEISNVVQNIGSQLKAKKTQLAPQIKELRSIRTKYDEVESTYLVKKKAYDAIANGLEAERLELEQGVEANVTGILEEESAFHFLNCLSQITQVRLDQMASETTYTIGSEKLNDDYKSYREMYEKKISEAEEYAKQLRKDKVQIKDAHGENIQQRSMFLSLRRIMQCKRDLQQNQTKAAHEEENRLIFGDGGEERLVMDNHD